MLFVCKAIAVFFVFCDLDEGCWAEGGENGDAAFHGRWWRTKELTRCVYRREAPGAASAAYAVLDMAKDLWPDGLAAECAAGPAEGDGRSHCEVCELSPRARYRIIVGSVRVDAVDLSDREEKGQVRLRWVQVVVVLMRALL